MGSFVTAVGIQLFLFANWGVDPISTLLLGMMAHLPIQFGTASQSFNVIILILVAILDWRKIGLGSIVNALSVGFFVNLLTSSGFVAKLPGLPLIYAVIGPIILGVGTGFYLAADLGCGALEGLMIVLSEKSGKSIKLIRMCLDFTLVVSGILLGSVYGVGTILGVLLIGPSIEYTIRLYHFLTSDRDRADSSFATENEQK